VNVAVDPSNVIESRESLAFLADGGEMGARIRGFDWVDSPLGPPDGWPAALKTTVGILLGSKFPMFVAWGPELRFIYNDAYAEVLGGKHPAALGASFDTIWAEIWKDVKPFVDRALGGDSTYAEDLPLTMTRKGQPEQTWFTFSYSPLRGESDRIEGMFCVCTETTGRVLAQQRRIDEAERLRRLFDHAPGFMAVLRGPDHVFELINNSYLKLVGHRDLVGRSVREALPEVQGQGFFKLLDQVYATGEPYAGFSMPIDLQREPGAPLEERLLDLVFQPIADESGRISGIFAEGYDVTERHRAEQALRESEERFRLIADSAPVPMWVTRLDRRRSFVNRSYVEFLGIDYDDATEFDWRSIIHPEDHDRIVAESLAGEASLQPFTLEGRYLDAHGEWRWIQSISRPRWGPTGEHAGFIGVAHDVTEHKLAEATLRSVNEMLERRVAERTADLSTALDRLQAEVGERRRAEEALRQAQKMEAVGQLTGGIAHDFNNLLTPIMGGFEVIAGKIEDPRLKRIAENGLEAARRGAKLTGQLLAFSRIQRIEMAPVAVDRVIDQMRSLLTHTIGSAIRVETRLSAEPHHGLCDANQLENAILNLAINARDAMPDGGQLTISTDCIRVEDDPALGPGDYVRIEVADTGHGMSPEVMQRATEPFYSTKPIGKGTGLGLAQVYGVARQSGGTLRIESEAGQGTKVQILIPAAAPAADEEVGDERAGSGTATGAGDAMILIVDDDAAVRAFLSDSLRGLGFGVVEAESGEQALAMLESSAPDLALVDYAMPGMNGASLAVELRAVRPDIPIVFVTGYAETDQLDDAIGANAPVLRKPFSIAELAATVNAHCRPPTTSGS
jgi:PAS domain S-box-containing protein